MSSAVMQTRQADLDPAVTGSLFSCSQSEIPCHHFCLKHSKPLSAEVEEWFMTDEVEEEDEEEETKQGEAARRSWEEEREMELMQEGLLDQLLDEAYAQYYEEPDEWEELANWYTSRMTSDESLGTEERSARHGQPSDTVSSGAMQHDFHPAWRQDPVGTPARSTSQGKAASGTPSGRFSDTTASTSHSTGQRVASEPDPAAGPRQSQPGPKQRDWGELVDEQEREEEMELSSGSRRRRRSSTGWSEAALVRECELYETFNDLFFPDPESGRL